MNKIESQRMFAEPINQADAREIQLLFNQAEARKYLHGIEYDTKKTFEFVAWCQKTHSKHMTSPYSFRCKITNDLIGVCGPQVEQVNGLIEFNFGYIINQKYWSKGYATEASLSLIREAFSKNLCESFVSVIQPDNQASKKVTTKLGFKNPIRTIFHGLDVDIYRLRSEDWQDKPAR